MLRTLLRNTILFLRQPIGTAILTWVISVALFSLQLQPWTLPIRVLLSLLPATIPAVLAALAVRYRERMNSAKTRLFLSGMALISWIALSLDIGQAFLPWVLVFSIALLFSFWSGLRYTSILALSMLFFAFLYGGLRLHQGEQLIYLSWLVQREQRKAQVQFTVKEENGRIRLFQGEGREAVLSVPVPEAMKLMPDPESDGFFGLSPAFVLTTDPNDTRAMPMMAVLLVPEGFPANLWNIQVNSDLEQLHRQGGIGSSQQSERKGTCGNHECTETLWLYEDRFQARTIQTGYALFSIMAAGPATGSQTFMIWFREPVIEGFPHHPLILEIIKGLTTSTEEKAN